MQPESNFLSDFNPLADLIKKIQEENISYKEDDIRNAVNEAQKKYQPESDSIENLAKIKIETLNILEWNKNLQ